LLKKLPLHLCQSLQLVRSQSVGGHLAEEIHEVEDLTVGLLLEGLKFHNKIG